MRRHQGGARRATLRLAVALAVFVTWASPRGVLRQADASSTTTPVAALFAWRSTEKVLFSYRDYELRYQPRGDGQIFPRVRLAKVPPKAVALAGLSGSIECGLDKRDCLGFPFTTRNTGSVQLGFPALAGQLTVSAEDPPRVTGTDAETPPKALEATYTQVAPGLGDVAVKVRSTGEWSASFSRQVEDLGRLHGSVNSQLDWNVDLDTAYPPVKGISPSVTYGATQDGMRVRASLDGINVKGVVGSYTVQNEAGKYSLLELVHDAKATLPIRAGQQVLEAQATFDRKFSQAPLRGSLAYTLNAKPVSLTAGVDYDNYKVTAGAALGKLSATVARVPVDGVRPMQLEVETGKVLASVQLGRDRPRLRMGFTV